MGRQAIRWALPAFLFAGTCLTAWAGNPSPAPTIASRVDELVQREMALRKLPSVSLVVMKDNVIVKQAAYGYARLDSHMAATPSTRYRLDSLTKQFTATAVLILQQQNLLQVDDQVSKYLPDAPPSWGRITIRDLLTHTAGFPRDSPTGYNDVAEQAHTPRGLLDRLYGIQPLTSPGWRFLYSNAGYAALGAIIETVSGQGYAEFLEKNVFLPAGMSSTRLDDKNYDDPALALGYAWEPSLRQWLARSQENSPAAAASIQSTVLDLAKWEIALQGESILNPQSKKQMWSPTVPGNGEDYEYGFGWFVKDCRTGRLISHGGSGWGYSTEYERYPDAGYTVIVLTNLQPGRNNYHADAIARAVAALYQPQLREPEGKAQKQQADKRSRDRIADTGYGN